MRKTLWLLILLSLLQLYSQAQVVCSSRPYSFKPDEQLQYEVSYNWGLLWINAGVVDFKASATTYGDEDAFHFVSTARSYRKFDWLFKVRDTFEVVSRQSDLHPLFFDRRTYEGSFNIFNQYHFDPTKKVAHARMEETGKALTFEDIALPGCTYDVLTATYVARSINFKRYQPGDTIGVSMLLDGKVFTLPVIFKGKDRIEDKNSKQWDCLLFSAILDVGTMFRAGEELLVYVSDDDQKVPVLIEAKITVGSIKIYLIDQQ